MNGLRGLLELRTESLSSIICSPHLRFIKRNKKRNEVSFIGCFHSGCSCLSVLFSVFMNEVSGYLNYLGSMSSEGTNFGKKQTGTSQIKN